MTEEKKGPTLLEAFKYGVPSRSQKMKIWAIRSALVLVVAGLIASRGPMWVLWVAIAYVVFSLGTGLWLTRK